jgi:RimJ/RimL family protein N-acetyltransferase
MLTKRLELSPLTRAQTLARIDAMTSAERAQLSADWLAQLDASGGEDPWVHGFTLVHLESGRTIGACGFKGPPSDADGAVEIAYGVDADQRGNGYATEAAAALVAYALADPRVRIVRAHTLPQPGPSPRVLSKCGFRHVGDIVDPEDGLVWRWERARDEAS